MSGIWLFCLSGSASPLFDTGEIDGEIIFHGESVIAHTHNVVKWVISSALLCKSYNCEVHGPLYSKRGFYSNMKLSLLSVKVFYRKKPKFKERRNSSKSELRYASCHYINTPFNTCKLSCLFFNAERKEARSKSNPNLPAAMDNTSGTEAEINESTSSMSCSINEFETYVCLPKLSGISHFMHDYTSCFCSILGNALLWVL